MKSWSRKMRDGVRDRVNVPIDSKLKRLFEDMQQRHGKSWTEVLENGVKEILLETDPIQILEYEIKIEDEKQEERRAALIRARKNVETLNIHSLDTEKEEKEREKKLQNLRLELFEKDFKLLHDQWRNQRINWSRIIDFGKFKDMKDAKKWLKTELVAKEIMEKYVNYQ